MIENTDEGVQDRNAPTQNFTMKSTARSSDYFIEQGHRLLAAAGHNR